MKKAHMLLLVQPKHEALRRAALWMANLAQNASPFHTTSKSVFNSSMHVYGRYLESEKPKFLKEANILLGATLKLAGPRIFEGSAANSIS